MKPTVLYLLAACLLPGATALAGGMADYLPHGMADYLPKKFFEGHFMRVAYPPRAAVLFKKMQAALNENREWFSEAVKNNKPGEPLPYDEKLGLTPGEYKEFLALGKKAQLKETLARVIRVVHNPDGTISLDAGAGFKTLGDLRFDLAHQAILTPYGLLQKPQPVDFSSQGEGGPFGPYKGLLFGMEGGEPGSTIDNPSGRTVSVTLGEILATGQRFIYYNVNVMEEGRRTTGIDMILEY